MTSGRTRRKVHRPPLDPSVTRYMVYRLHDESGAVLYVGRSCNVAARIRAHESECRWHPAGGPSRAAEKAAWFYRSRSVSMVGPYTWAEACRVERAEIEAHQPIGNRQFTKAHGYRPLSEGGGQYVGRRAHSP